jgi:hypothetical protein
MGKLNSYIFQIVRSFQGQRQIIKETAQINRDFVNLENKGHYSNGPKTLDLSFVMQLLGNKSNENSFSDILHKREEKTQNIESKSERIVGEESYLFNDILLSPETKHEFSIVGGLLEQAILSSKGGGIGIFKRIDQQAMFEEEKTKRNQHFEEFSPAKSDMSYVTRLFLSPNLSKTHAEVLNKCVKVECGIGNGNQEETEIDISISDLKTIREKCQNTKDVFLFDYLNDKILLALCPELKTPHGALKRLKRYYSEIEEMIEQNNDEEPFNIKAELYHAQLSQSMLLFGEKYVSEEKMWKKLSKEYKLTIIKCKKRYSEEKDKKLFS